MKKYALSGLAVLMSICSAAPASAVTSYTSLLTYKDTGGSTATQSGPFAKVLLQEIDSKTINVTVTLFSPEVGFLNTGGPHDPFLFNLTGNYPVTVTNTTGQTFVNGGYDSDTVNGPNFTATPFGNFTNKIACCDDKNGASHMSPPPLTFSVHDDNGITVAGIGALFDPNSGKLFALGTGDHFTSNGGGWWFAADLVDSQGRTFNVAARDMYRLKTGAVPEPASWALMITGFGAVGVAMRRRRTTERQVEPA
jgi:hypothetical protein